MTVAYTTADGTATAGSDYVTTSGTLTFAAGSTTQTVNVPVIGDTLDEADETFLVNLSAPVNAALGTPSQGVGTITDNDTTPTLRIAPTSMTEGNTGTSPATFTVTLSAPSGRVVTVNYATANGTATTAAGDYTATSGTLSFPIGTTTRQVTVPVIGDLRDEVDETFNLVLERCGQRDDYHRDGRGDDHRQRCGAVDHHRQSDRAGRLHPADDRDVHRPALGGQRQDGHGELRDRQRDGDCRQRLHREDRHGHLRRGRHHRDVHRVDFQQRRDRTDRDVLRQPQWRSECHHRRQPVRLHHPGSVNRPRFS